jgi:hypothetical protein
LPSRRRRRTRSVPLPASLITNPGCPVRQSRFECLAYPGGGPLLLGSSLLGGYGYRTVPINPTTLHLLPNTAGRHQSSNFGECE